MSKRQYLIPRDEQQPPRKWRKVIIYSDSDESENSDSEQQMNTGVIDDVTPPLDKLLDNSIAVTETTPAPEPELDADLLAALGDPMEDIPEYGEDILQDLAQRWLPILRKGISKDKKELFLKDHTIPANCKLLRAPTLNAEISAASSDISRARDKKLENNQNQLGLGISAVSRGLSVLITKDDKDNKVRAIKYISESTVSNILIFLSDCFNNGDSYGSLNSHRSALSLLLGTEIGANDQIKRFFKGVYKLRPTVPKYTITWDPQIVLNYISDWFPNDSLSLEKITKKLTMLLAICTAHRVQTLSLIKIQNIKFCSDGVKIVIADIIKTSAIGKEQPILCLPYFTENQSICPATAIRDYITMTEKLRHNIPNLLLTFKRPHRAATAQSISRWIKLVLGEAGVDVATFSAHSARHAATSAAHSAGVPLHVIRKAAGWTSNSTFGRFYHRQVIDDGSFARSVCLPE